MSNNRFDKPMPIGKNLAVIGQVDGDLMVQSGQNTPVRLGSFLAHTHGGAGWELDSAAIAQLLDDA